MHYWPLSPPLELELITFFLWEAYGTCHNKVSVGHPYIHPFVFQPSYAHTRTCRTPVPVDIVSTPVFVKHRISTRKCKSFVMFAKQSTCYFCRSSSRVPSLLSPFQSVHFAFSISRCFVGRFIWFKMHVGVIHRYVPAFSTATYSCSTLRTCFVWLPL